MNKDLRTFLGEVRQLGPDYFASVSRAVDPIFEPSVIQQKLAAEGRYPMLRFENINGSDLPLATNMFASYELLGLALEVDPASFDAFVGRYQLAPGFVLEFSREEGRFYIQATNQPKIEVFPESETQFFAKAVDAKISFVGDADGAPDHAAGET